MTEIYSHGDTPEQIAKCLSCKRKECTNCLEWEVRPACKRRTPSRPRPLARYAHNVAVEQIDPRTGEVVAVYSTVLEAAKAVGRIPPSISAVLIGRNKTCAGYFWRRVVQDIKDK